MSNNRAKLWIQFTEWDRTALHLGILPLLNIIKRYDTGAISWVAAKGLVRQLARGKSHGWLDLDTCSVIQHVRIYYVNGAAIPPREGRDFPHLVRAMEDRLAARLK